MTKKNAALLGGIMIITGGLLLRSLGKNGKLEGIMGYLDLFLSNGKKSKKKLDNQKEELDLAV